MCDDGALRLVGGDGYLSGRVEICFNEAWGTICDNQFDTIDSSVICGQLGFSRFSNNSMHDYSQVSVYYETFITVDSVAASGATFGEGTGRVLINSLQCFGNETILTQCPGADSVTSSCPHSRDIGVVCQIKKCK